MTKARDLADGASALSAVSATELGYLDGVTSAVQTQINSKQAVVSGVNDTEIGYLDGVTSAVQTQLDAKIPKTLTTTTGDIIYASSANTPARLGIGSTAQVLTVSGGVPAWATASAGALTLIHTETLSAVSAVNMDNKFTSTYANYLVIANIEQSTANVMTIQYRSGASSITSGYKTTHWYTEYTNNTWNVNSTYVSGIYGVSSNTDRNVINMLIADPYSSEYTKSQILSTDNTYNVGFNGLYPQTTSIDGLRFSVSTGTMTGTVRIYGYQNS